MGEQLSAFLREQQELFLQMFKQQQDNLATQMQQLKQTLQDQVDDHNIENDTPITTFSRLPEHQKQKMKMKLEYDHSNPALFPAFES